MADGRLLEQVGRCPAPIDDMHLFDSWVFPWERDPPWSTNAGAAPIVPVCVPGTATSVRRPQSMHSSPCRLLLGSADLGPYVTRASIASTEFSSALDHPMQSGRPQ